MKTLKYFFLFIVCLPLLHCEKEDTEPERTTHLVKLENNTGITGCSTGGLTVSFIVSYRDVQVNVDIEQERSAIINVLVEDKESINVKIQRTSDDAPLADADVIVRTTSRPDHLENEHRRIAYCQAFNLKFLDF